MCGKVQYVVGLRLIAGLSRLGGFYRVCARNYIYTGVVRKCNFQSGVGSGVGLGLRGQV